MSSGYSGIVQLNDLDDFIGPGQECIKPIKSEKPKDDIRKQRIRKIEIETDGSVSEINNNGSSKKLEKAKISLEDCLACSGCVTSAEAVLISQHSSDELLKVIEANRQFEMENKPDHVKLIVISISPQSVSSIAAKHNMDLTTCSNKLRSFFKDHLSSSHVLDTVFARNFSLIESGKEFVAKYKQTQQLTVLTSSCPGWICYAEKTHGSFILPHISKVKSPQQIMGSLVKDYLSRAVLKVPPEQIYHVSIMPCFDKKLESSRKDFIDELTNSKDVDCVLSTIELEELLDRQSLSLADLPGRELEPLFDKDLYTHVGGGSGGYLEYVLRYAGNALFGYEQTRGRIVYKQLKNADFREVMLEVDGECKLKFAYVYGFRNIQNIVQKLKRKQCQYQYIEVMACPSGCLNGGGQLRDENTKTLSKEIFAKVEAIYNSVDIRVPEENKLVTDLYNEKWLANDLSKISKYLYTSYHEIEKTNNGLLVKW